MPAIRKMFGWACLRCTTERWVIDVVGCVERHVPRGQTSLLCVICVPPLPYLEAVVSAKCKLPRSIKLALSPGIDQVYAEMDSEDCRPLLF
jgi:hypothetical protein